MRKLTTLQEENLRLGGSLNNQAETIGNILTEDNLLSYAEKL